MFIFVISGPAFFYKKNRRNQNPCCDMVCCQRVVLGPMTYYFCTLFGFSGVLNRLLSSIMLSLVSSVCVCVSIFCSGPAIFRWSRKCSLASPAEISPGDRIAAGEEKYPKRPPSHFFSNRICTALFE